MDASAFLPYRQRMMMLSLTAALVALNMNAQAGDKIKIGTLTFSEVDTVQKAIPEKDVSVLGFVLQKTTFQEINAELGGASIQQSGSGGDYLARMCYRGGDGTILIFESTDLGGGSQHISGFQLSTAEAAGKHLPKCKRNNKIGHDLKLANGLHLGSKRREVKKIFGEPGKDLPGTLIYHFHKARRPAGEDVEETVGVYAQSAGGKIYSMTVQKSVIR
jgi:hypothetical protein